MSEKSFWNELFGENDDSKEAKKIAKAEDRGYAFERGRQAYKDRNDYESTNYSGEFISGKSDFWFMVGVFVCLFISILYIWFLLFVLIPLGGIAFLLGLLAIVAFMLYAVIFDR